MEETSPKEQPRQVPVLLSVTMFWAMLMMAGFLILPDIRVWNWALFFPMGLSRLMAEPWGNSPVNLGLTIIAYAIYPVFFAAFVRAHTWKLFWWVCFILACVLLLNILGCRQMLDHHSTVHGL